MVLQASRPNPDRGYPFLPNRKIATIFASMDTHPLVDVASQPNPAQESESLNRLSKKAQKRAAKAARLHEFKLERRAREKEAKKHKRRERAQAIARGQPDENASRKRRRTNAGGETEIFNARVVVDLGFDELMSDKVGVSLYSCLSSMRQLCQG
jgi:tRNA (guanine9-N1)-methyltransferase